MRTLEFFLLLAYAFATDREIRQVQAYRAANARHDLPAHTALLAPDARMWYEERKGDGEPLRTGGGGRYAHWDAFFHSKSTLNDWKVEGNAVSAIVHETNDFYRLLDWTPVPYRMTWWLGDNGKITGALVQSLPGKPPPASPSSANGPPPTTPRSWSTSCPKGTLIRRPTARSGCSGCCWSGAPKARASVVPQRGAGALAGVPRASAACWWRRLTGLVLHVNQCAGYDVLEIRVMLRVVPVPMGPPTRNLENVIRHRTSIAPKHRFPN
jgi:hypothetical protein